MRTEKRLAKVGERVLIIEPSLESDFIREGDIGIVTEKINNDCIIVKVERSNEKVVIIHNEYEVITGDDMVGYETYEQDKMEVLFDDLVEAIEVNSKKMRQEHEDGHDYAYLRYLQGKDQAYREILEMIDREAEVDE